MGVLRLNHAALAVSDLERSVAFYEDVLHFRVVDNAPGDHATVLLQAENSANDHDLALHQAPGAAVRSVLTGRGGLCHLAWEVDTLHTLEEVKDRLEGVGMLDDVADHGTAKSVYGHDPDHIQLEVVWLVPRDLLTLEAQEERWHGHELDLTAQKVRYGPHTQGGLGTSR